MVKVSVIVPVYNGEKSINECMKCLMEQTMKDFEVIVVDDASQDNSKNLLNKWAEKYPTKIKVISSDINRGAGGARNLGISYAQGEYIGFMDCDDFAESCMYEKLYNKAVDENCDIVDCGYYNEAEENTLLHITDEIAVILNNNSRSELIINSGYLWSKIFKKSFLENINITFRENVIYEDLDFLIKVVMNAEKIGSVQEVLYVYKNNQESCSNIEKEQKKFEDMISVINELENLVQEGTKEAVEYVILSCYAAAIGNCLFNQENPQFLLVENLKKLKEIQGKLDLKKYKNNIYVSKNMTEESIELIDWFSELKV